MNALNDMKQDRVQMDSGTAGIGVVVSDSLMFQRGDPAPSDLHLSHFYGLALPMLKRGIPVTPVQLENVTIPRYLENFRVLLLTYQGMKPLSPEVHTQLAEWVKQGGALMVCDDDSDSFNSVREWWISDGLRYATPREHLFAQLGKRNDSTETNSLAQTEWRCGRGGVLWLRKNPAELAARSEGSDQILTVAKRAATQTKLKWRETNYLLLRRGPYVIAAGLDVINSGWSKMLSGKFVNLFDPELRVQKKILINPGERLFLRDLNFKSGDESQVLASACKVLQTQRERKSVSFAVEGVAGTPAVVLCALVRHPAWLPWMRNQSKTSTIPALKVCFGFALRMSRGLARWW